MKIVQRSVKSQVLFWILTSGDPVKTDHMMVVSVVGLTLLGGIHGTAGSNV